MKGRGPLNGLIAIAALVGVLYLGKTAYEHEPPPADTEPSEAVELDQAEITSFYDDAMRQIESTCGPNDRRCEDRVKREVAQAHGIPEEQADGVFLKERLRRGRQGR